MAFFETDNVQLKEAFDWAVQKIPTWVQPAGEIGPVNEGLSPDAVYIPCFVAGHKTRTCFFSRDYVHSVYGAEFMGLREECYHMMKAFAESAWKSRNYYAIWAINFDGKTPHRGDYFNEDRFVREIPAQFELVESAYRQYLWTGDERYISDEMFEFYTHIMVDFVNIYDTNGNGIPEGVGDMEDGYATYDERIDARLPEGTLYFEAGDAIGCQYQAMLAYAGFCKARGDMNAYAEWCDKAAALKKYFNEEWSVIDGDKNGIFAHAVDLKDHTKKYSGFSVETSVLMPLKLVTEPGERTDRYLDLIDAGQGTGIGFPGASNNIEGYTYYPELYFLYDKIDTAWKWMKYILDTRHLPHESPRQGPNGNYPEISFNVVAHTVQGMMGVDVNVPEGKISTFSRLPNEVKYTILNEYVIGDHKLSIMHYGRNISSLTNHEGEVIEWTAYFVGDHDVLMVDAVPTKAQHTKINGVDVSYVTVKVKHNYCITVNVPYDC